MELEALRGAHEGGEVIIAGNGPGLKNIPFAFLESRPLFVLNFFATWATFIKPSYWVALDPLCFKAAEDLNPTTLRMVKAHNKALYEEELNRWGIDLAPDQTVYYRMGEKVPGLRWNDDWGVQYSTSAIAAAHLALYMGAKKALVVGFDCTHGIGGYDNLDNFKGLSRIPHFYDHRYHFDGYSDHWDMHFGMFSAFAEERGMEVINLSIPTQSKRLKRGDYRDYWEPEGGYYEQGA
jgi:hypothetical protein